MSTTLSTNPTETTASLSAAELQMLETCYQSIDLADTYTFLNYGVDIQKKLSELSEGMLTNLTVKNMDEISETLHTTITYLQDIDKTQGKFTLWGEGRKLSLREKYREAEKSIDKVTGILEQHRIQLMKDCAVLEHLYHMNEVYSKTLQLQILAGKRKLMECTQNQLPLLEKKAHETGLSQDSQSVADTQNRLNHLQQRISELELTGTVSQQSASLIRLLRSNHTAMAEKIQSILLNTIPLWKNQMVLAFSMEHNKQAATAQATLHDMTMKRLQQNNENITLASAEMIQNLNNTLYDGSSLETTNKLLIERLTEVRRMQQEEAHT